MSDVVDPVPAEPAAQAPRRVVRPAAWLRSPAGKAGLLLALLLLMQAPLNMIGSLIAERQARQEAVEAEFRNSWGPAQSVSGPVLAVPYATPDADQPAAPRHRGWVEVPADQLTLSAVVTPQTRRRGLFEAVVYTAALELDGTLAAPEVAAGNPPGTVLQWDEAVLAVGATDLRGQPPGSSAQVGDGSVPLSLLPAADGCGAVATAPLRLAAAPAAGARVSFHAKLVLRGTRSLFVTPLGQRVDVQAAGPWSSPGFTGATLPSSSRVDGAGFQAQWQLAGDALSVAPRVAAWQRPLCTVAKADSAALGVDLLQPVPTYLTVSRAAKYGTLSLALAFLTYFLFETVSGLRIHLAQYALLGASVSLFPLLLVALAEPLGFTAGYVLSTAAIMGQASLYTLSVVGARRLAALFAVLLGVLFGFLYVVLSLESLSLLTGTLALFAGLSVVMLVTRRVEWGRPEARRSVP